jgi:hypothetical protein
MPGVKKLDSDLRLRWNDLRCRVSISVTFARDSRSSKPSERAELLSFNVPTVDLSYSVLSIDFAALPARTTTGMTKRQNRDARRENIPDVNSEVHSWNPLCSTR